MHVCTPECLATALGIDLCRWTDLTISVRVDLVLQTHMSIYTYIRMAHVSYMCISCVFLCIYVHVHMCVCVYTCNTYIYLYVKREIKRERERERAAELKTWAICTAIMKPQAAAATRLVRVTETIVSCQIIESSLKKSNEFMYAWMPGWAIRP